MPEISRKLQNYLLICGILAPLLNIGTDLLAGTLYEGYSFIYQSVSVLTSVGASTRVLVVTAGLIYDVLLFAFAFSIWTYAKQNRNLKLVALTIMGNVSFLLIAVFFPLHAGEDPGTFANTMNTVIMGISVIFILLAVVFSAVAMKNYVRYYSIGMLLTFLMLTVVGILVVPQDPSESYMPTTGAQERTMVYCINIWILLLAVTLLHKKNDFSKSPKAELANMKVGRTQSD